MKTFNSSKMINKINQFNTKMQKYETVPSLLQTNEEFYECFDLPGQLTTATLVKNVADQVSQLLNAEAKKCTWFYKNGMFVNTIKNVATHYAEYYPNIGNYRFMTEIGPVVLEFIAENETTTQLHTIKIAKEARNQGLGTKIMNIILDECDAAQMTLKVLPCATDAISDFDFIAKTVALRKFYEELDFVPVNGAWMQYTPEA